ncbi:MAG: DUF1501 domain-containing protein [Dehalococcoidia bacterium]|nr:DUF1501 domain-containing protein [Dehalococcoidia bacterium]
MISRRDFVRGGVALVSIGTTANSLLKGTIAFAAQNPRDVNTANNGKILVLVQLAGGNDGLNTVVPLGDSTYHSVRKAIGFKDEDLLPLGSGLSLAPQLSGLKGLWDSGKLAVVRGVGYPDQNYSHFKSMAIWQSGDPELKLQDGWLGRTLDQMESQSHDPFLGFNIGGSTPPELRGEKVAIPSVQNPAAYGFQKNGKVVDSVNDGRTATLMKLYEQYPAQSPYGVLLESTVESAVSSAQQLAKAGSVYKPAVEYPKTSFGSGLSVLAEAIVGNLGMRVGHITLGGFDTHAKETDDHAKLMSELDQGLTAFYNDLAKQGRADDVLVLTWSEFGRRVQENANGGTDHGSASIMFALGNGVKQGFYGDQPSLTKLVDNGNLSFTTDFRSVYSTVIDRWLGVPSEALLGKQWGDLGFLTA